MKFLKQKYSTQSKSLKIESSEFDVVGATYYAVAPAGHNYSDLQTEYYGARKYNTLSAAEGGLPASPTTPMIINIIGTWSSADTAAVTFDGTTTSATNHILVRTIGDARHGGVWDTGAYRHSRIYGTNLTISDQHVSIEGLQMEITETNDLDQDCVVLSTAIAYLVNIDSCLFRGAATNTQNYHTAVQQWSGVAGSVVNIRNCIADGFVGLATGCAGFLGYSGTGEFNIENSSAVNCHTGFWSIGSGFVKATNCLAQDNINGYNGVFDSASDYNVSDLISDAPGDNSRTGNVVFVDADNDDYHLAVNDTVARGNGTNLSDAFTTDIDGNKRSHVWDIGASIAPDYNQEEFNIIDATYYAVAEAGYIYSEEQTAFYSTRKYNTLSAAEAALAGSPTTPQIINILGSWSSADGAVTFNSTTTAANYISVQCIGEARHNGIWSNTAYRASQITMDDVGHIKIVGLQTTGINSVSSVSTDYCTIDSVIIDSAGTWDLLFGFGNSANLIVKNSLFYGDLIEEAIYVYTTTFNISNCTVIGGTYNIRVVSGTARAKNVITQGSSDGFHGTWDTANCSNNVSDLSGDAPGSGSLNSHTVTFADSANNDYRLSAADSELFTGVEVPSVKVDMLGVKRRTWSIGAFEFVRNESFDHYVELDGSSDYISTPDSAANSVTGDIDIRAKVAFGNVGIEDHQIVVAKSLNDTDDYVFQKLWTSNTFTLFVGGVSKTSAAFTGVTDDTAIWVRVICDIDNGSGGADFKFYQSSNEGVSWTQVGTTITHGSTLTVTTSSTPLYLGIREAWGSKYSPLVGKIYYAEVRDGIDGDIVARFNAADVDASHTYFANIDTEDKWTNNGATYVPGDFEAESQDYFERHKNAGGALSTTTKTAVDAFIKSAKAKKYWPKLKRVNLMCGDWTGLMVPLKNTLGGTTETNSGFVTGDYDEDNGLAGDGSSYIDTDISVNELTVGNLHIGFIGIGVINSGSSAKSLLGAIGGASAYSGLLIYDWGYWSAWGRGFYCDNDTDSNGSIQALSTDTGQPTTGFICGNQQNTSSTKIYQNGFLIDEDTDTISTWSNSENIYIMATNINGTDSYHSNATCRGYTIGEALTDAEVIFLNENLNEFNTAINRGLETVPTTNLQAHYKADYGVFSDAGSAVAVADDQVYQWNDQSINGNHVTQTTAGDRPLYRINKQNGLPGIEFISTDWLEVATMITAQPFTIYTIAEIDSLDNTDIIWSFADSSKDYDYFDLWFSGGAAGDPATFSIKANGTGGEATTTVGYEVDTATLVTIQAASTTDRSAWIDNGSVGTNTTDLTPATIDIFSIGMKRDLTPNTPMVGFVYEILVYNVAHDAATRAQIHEYLKNKWNV